MSDELALIIGRHVLEQYSRWTENPMGKKIIIPVQLPHRSDQPPWDMNIECNMPWFVEDYFENGERKFKHWSMRQWWLKEKSE